eukprot:s1246_g14.t1
MPCAECGVFSGTPTCGACKAVVRIGSLLRSGHLTLSQEKRVTEVLRSAAGELADLIEANQGQKVQEGATPPQEGTSGLTSGPSKPATPGAEAGKKKDEDEYSYGSGEFEESEEENTADKKEGGEDKEKPDKSGEERGKAEKVPSPSPGRADKEEKAPRASWDPRCDPQYLTRRLELRPVPKPHSGRSRDRERERRRERSPRRASKERSSGARSPEGRAPRAEGGHHEEREDRPPLPRRPQPAEKPKKKGRGLKKRERTQAFRAKKIEERRAKKAARPPTWRPKPKQREWREEPRRPSRRQGGGEAEGADVSVHLHTVPLQDFKPGSSWVVTEGEYFGAPVKMAGIVQRVEVDRDASYLYMRLTGTDNEEVLKVHTGQQDAVFKAHICKEGCGRIESGALLFHAVKGRLRRADNEEPWVSTLEGIGPRGEDELAALRVRQGQVAGPGEGETLPKVVTPPGQAEPAEKEKAVKKKKKEKEDRSREEKMASGRMPAKAVQKEASLLYGGTALDPKERVRKRVMKAAKKFAAKKKSKRSSTSSEAGSSSSSSSTLEGATGTDGVFSEETKTKALGDKFPGALAMETLTTMRKNLLATAGEEGDEQSTRPIALLYYRNVLGRKASGAQARELLNISSAIDALLKSRPAQAMDILCQRLKAQEAVLNGTNWAVAQRIDLASPDATSLIARGELQVAHRETYLDSRARWQSQSTPGAKGTNKGKAKGKSDQSTKEDQKGDHRKDKGKGGEKK